MSGNSFENINYFLRPNKQVERKLILDQLQVLNREFDIQTYEYIGMGSIYFFDFILLHKYFNVNRMSSVEDKSSTKRFDFNKPYDFIEFHNCTTTTFLANYKWNCKSMIWLDYDTSVFKNTYFASDLAIIGRNCKKNDLLYLTINCSAPGNDQQKHDFLAQYSNYISPKYNSIQYLAQSKLPFLLQDILINIISESCLYNNNKFIKLCSFAYKDGAPMFTLGGIFTDDSNFLTKIGGNHCIDIDNETVREIKIPHITYREKFYLDSNIDLIRLLYSYAKEGVNNFDIPDVEKSKRLSEILAEELPIELSEREILNYITNYRYIPQYYEGIL